MAARKAPLRALDPNEKPEPKRPLAVGSAAEGGDRLELLVALRTRIAKSVEDPETPPRDLAALSLRLLAIAKEIEAIEAEGGEDDIGTAAAIPDEEWAAT